MADLLKRDRVLDALERYASRSLRPVAVSSFRAQGRGFGRIPPHQRSEALDDTEVPRNHPRSHENRGSRAQGRGPATSTEETRAL
jgi:hypothetical protein